VIDSNKNKFNTFSANETISAAEEVSFQGLNHPAYQPDQSEQETEEEFK